MGLCRVTCEQVRFMTHDLLSRQRKSMCRFRASTLQTRLVYTVCGRRCVLIDCTVN